MRRLRPGLAAAALGSLLALAVVAPASAADPSGPAGASIDHAEVRDGGVRLLVSVPASGTVDVGGVDVEVAGKAARSTTAAATGNADVRRTTVLAIDTSNSMRGERIAAAKRAAALFLDTAPPDVAVGLVSFDDDVQVLVEPSRDRAALRRAVAGLTLTRDTALYDGVLGAVEASGGQGARSLLVLSDGKDTTDTPLSEVLRTLEQEDVSVDVVSLDQGDAASQPLQLIARAGGGQVMDADPASLSATFAGEADALRRQLAVDVTLPQGTEPQADVTVTLPVDGRAVTASAFLTVGSAEPAAEPVQAPAATGPVAAAGPRIDLPPAAVAVGVGAIGLGLLGMVVALFVVRPGASKDEKLRKQLEAYGVYGAPQSRDQAPADQGLGAQARQVAEKALAGNQGLEARIAARLDKAGMSLKPAEWLLVHAGVTVLAAVLGMLLSRGNILLALVFLALGAAGGWVYLGLRKSRRLKAFASGLADTLQLMSGSLSAGLSLAQSVDTIVKEGSDPIAGEFRRVIVESRLGVPLEESLGGVAERMESKDFEWVVMAIKIQRQVGGNLAELLLQVAATLREREYLRRQVLALSAEGRLSAYILGALPPVFLLYLSVSNPDYVSVFFTTTIGYFLLGVMAVLLVVGFTWMLKVAKVDV
ncbi:type II secretion system F family protein [Nocardioides aurantiacus]|uniref:Tight adherence protein B n=1 Tax=Nocardioides aurantiacus TaxID=86796 RepID=A0A3N2CSE1_9ACTN|nr:type II secretion system F family protein [Nocardioides aurantiacus]ROR90452.1 tight adherence protein B [Nocardioides aurantiacus]